MHANERRPVLRSFCKNETAFWRHCAPECTVVRLSARAEAMSAGAEKRFRICGSLSACAKWTFRHNIMRHHGARNQAIKPIFQKGAPREDRWKDRRTHQTTDGC